MAFVTTSTKPPIPVDDLEPISVDDLLPDNTPLSPREQIALRRLNPPDARYGDPTPRTSPRIGRAVFEGLGDLVTGAVRSVTTDRPEALLFKTLTPEGRKEIAEPAIAQGRRAASLPSGPRKALAVIGGTVPFLGPMIEQIGQPLASSLEGSPVTPAETHGAVRAGTTATGMMVGPKITRGTVKRLGPPLQQSLGVRTPSRMMNRMLAEGDPAGMAEAIDKSMDRTNYSVREPRNPGVSNPGLRNLDVVRGQVANAEQGALKTRANLEQLHQVTQSELTTKFGNVQVPVNELMDAIQGPIIERARNVHDAVAPGSLNKLGTFMKRHTERFVRETGGATDPATINAYKKSLYDLLNDKDFQKVVGDDPSLQGILRDQANSLMQLVNRYTTDPASGVSPVSELNRAYGDQRTALNAWEGLIVRKEVGRAKSGIMAPSSLTPESLAAVPLRRGVLGKLAEVWYSPWRVTTNANLLRHLAPGVAQPIPRLMPAPVPPTAAAPTQGLLSPAPPTPPAQLPPTNAGPQPLLPPPARFYGSGGAPPTAIPPEAYAPQPKVVPVPQFPRALPPAPIDILPSSFESLSGEPYYGGWRVREPLNFGESGSIPTRTEQTIPLNQDYLGPRVPAPIKRLTPYEEVTNLFDDRNKLVSEEASTIINDRNANVVLKDAAARRQSANAVPETTTLTTSRRTRTGEVEIVGRTNPARNAILREAWKWVEERFPRASKLIDAVEINPAEWMGSAGDATAVYEPGVRGIGISDTLLDQALIDRNTTKLREVLVHELTHRAQDELGMYKRANETGAPIADFEKSAYRRQDWTAAEIEGRSNLPPRLKHLGPSPTEPVPEFSNTPVSRTVRPKVSDHSLDKLSPQQLDDTIKINEQRLADLDRDISDSATTPSDRAAYQKDADALRTEISDLRSAKSRVSSASIGRGAGGIAEPLKTSAPPRLPAPPTKAKPPLASPAELLGDRSKSVPVPKTVTKPPAEKPAEIDYSTLSESDLRTQLKNATQLRDTLRKTSAGSNSYRKAEQRVKDIEAEIAKGPKRISANRNGQRIEGVYARSFKSGDGRQALIIRADDNSERMVFDDEIEDSTNSFAFTRKRGMAEWPKDASALDENDRLFMKRINPETGKRLKFPVPTSPATLLPDRFTNAKRTVYGTPVKKRIESSGETLGLFGVEFDPQKRKNQTASANTVLISADPDANDTPSTWTHETGHVVYDKDLTPKERETFQKMTNKVILDIMTQVRSIPASTTNREAELKRITSKYPLGIVHALASYKNNRRRVYHESFAELMGQYMVNPTAFQATYPGFYDYYKQVFGGKEYK